MIPCALDVPLPWLGPEAASRNASAPTPGSVRETLLWMAAPAWAAVGLDCTPAATPIRIGRFEVPAWTCAVRVQKGLNEGAGARSKERR